MRYIIFLLIFSIFTFNFQTDVFASKPKTLVIVGDSLTEGYGVSRESAYPALLETKIKEKTSKTNTTWKVVNSGVSGSTTASAISRVKWVTKSKPEIVMIALGANDGLRGLKVSESQKNLEEALEYLKMQKIQIILGGLYMPPNYGKEYSDQFKNMYSSLSKKYNAKLIPFILEKVAGDPKYNLADGIHPNEEGHKIIADTVFKQIEGLLK